MMPIVMGSCYLDKGEGAQYITEQVMRMAKMNPEYYFFDIICHPRQLKEATELLLHFYYQIGEQLPGLLTTKVFAGISCDDMIRPAASALMIMQPTGNVDMIDINPGRMGR